jgi:hypothetical protein
VIQLSHDADNTGVAADLDIRFPTDLVEFHAPVIINCRIAGRLAATHQVAGAVPEAGLVRLAFIPRDLVLLPFHEGELATCDFRILSGADAPSAALTIEFVGLVNEMAEYVPVVGVAGAIVIADVTPKPTATVPPAQCIGDCNGDLRVTVDELVRGTRIALGALPLTACQPLDRNGDGAVSIPELVTAVNRSLGACPAAGFSSQ